ncbi:MAG: ribonuclease III [Hyphomicrobiaceae bacterium]
MPKQSTKSTAQQYDQLESRLGYAFKDDKWLRRAVVHASARARKDIDRDNERLEFLGDRVLGLTIAEVLFRKFPDANEGSLARTFNSLVRKEACAQVAEQIELGAFLELGGGELKGGGRRKMAILGDACEAVMGAVFIDGGFEAARDVIERLWSHMLEIEADTRADAKTALQEWAQGQGLPLPSYDDIERSGPDHRSLFKMAVRIDGLEPGEGSGESKRAAQQEAARVVLEREGVWEAEAPND